MRIQLTIAALIGMLATVLSVNAAAETFTVNTLIDDSDSNDLNPGDGLCRTFDGDCSMRAAIQEANALSGADAIEFSVAGTIMLDGGLGVFPTITGTLRIRGETAPGYPGFSTDLEDAEPSIYIDGEAAGLGSEGLDFGAGALLSSVRALGVINFPIGIRLSGNAISVDACYIGVRGNETGNGNITGIRIDGANSSIGRFSTTLGVDGYGNVISGNEIGIASGGDRTRIAGNRIGTRPDGDQALPNEAGITLLSDNNEIGFVHQNGTPVGNVIAGNSSDGIFLIGSGNEIYANYIGVNTSFARDLGNGLDGIRINLIGNGMVSNDNIIGGVASGLANFIAGNRNGIAIAGDSSRNIIAGNEIGVDVGTLSQGNREDGVLLEGASGTLNQILSNSIILNGGNGITVEKDNTRIYGNTIGVRASQPGLYGGNDGDGIRVNSVFSSIGFTDPGFSNTIGYSGGHGINIGNRLNGVTGNFIGTMDSSGAVNVANAGDGVHMERGLDSPDQNQVQSNVIAYNALAGIYMIEGIGSLLDRNSIFSNGGLGIDLAPIGPTPNDPGDADSGPNFLQNYPVIMSVTYDNVPDPPELNVQWTVESTAGFNGIGRFYLADSAISGEGKTFLNGGNTAISMSGEIVSSVLILPAGVTSGHLVSTVRNQAGNTSEFSPPVAFSGPDVLFYDGFED